MEFTIKSLVPCLEGLGAELIVGEAATSNAACRPFFYAATVAPEQQSIAIDAVVTGTDIDVIGASAASATPTALAILPLDTALELPAAALASRPVLAIATQWQLDDALSRNSTATAAQALPIAITELSPTTVCDAVNAYLTRIREWDAAMANAVINGCSTQELLDLSEPMLGSYIALTDALYSAVAITPSFPPLDEMSHALVETGTYPASALASIEAFAGEQGWSSQHGCHLDQEGNAINPLPSMSRIYRLSGNYAAHLVMVRPARIEPWRQALFEMLAERMGQCLERFWRTSLPYRERGTSFLEAIIEDSVHDEADFAERARLFDFPLTGVFEMIVVTGAEERGGIAHIVHQIRAGIPQCRAAVIGQRIYILLTASAKQNGKIAAEEEKIFEAVERLNAEAGVSSRFDELINAHMARLEADVALEYGHKNYPKYLPLQTSEPYISCVFRFNRYFPCYLVDPYSDTAEFMAEFSKAPNIVNRLRWADHANGTNDFGLLKLYLYFDCSIKRTAEVMNMHRNTVIYRLDKIRREYHIDLDDSDTRLFLHYLFGVLD